MLTVRIPQCPFVPLTHYSPTNICHKEVKRLVLTVGIIASFILLFQSVPLSYRTAVLSTSISEGLSPSPVEDVGVSTSKGFITSTDSSTLSVATDERIKVGKESKARHENGIKDKDLNMVHDPEGGIKGDKEDEIDLDEDVVIDDNVLDGKDIELTDNFTLRSTEESKNESTFEGVSNSGKNNSIQSFIPGQEGLSQGKIQKAKKGHLGSTFVAPPTNNDRNVDLDKSVNVQSGDLISPPPILETTNQSVETLPGGEKAGGVDDDSAQQNENMAVDLITPKKKERSRSRPITTISEMNHMLQRSHITFSSKQRRPSNRDRELLSARSQIENAPVVDDDWDLHPPLFRNVSRFKKSYELMERILKVYVYKDGERPIFHTPMLEGIYASEGWFLKLMERNKHYTVRDHRKAHLFYLPFSSFLLEFAFSKRGLRKREMAARLLDYVNTISRKYPFWNRTRGTDHFLAACHDWAPYETTPHLLTTIRALCNADVSEGFELGKDVSLPETYVRSAQKPLRDLGGNPATKRPYLAFFAGKMHGWVRPILLQHWEGKDPDMKIFGPMPQGVKSKMNYIRYMKNSKYCICPRGYEVNSPRVVEAIFYECVPVIISDNFVPPLFEVLNWEAFTIFVAEKDIPNLKNILLSIPEEKYMTMQHRIKKLQRHFLWHKAPVKYDLFHMTLHSIWLNRVNQIRL